jgi:hypothetical protein
MLTNSTKGIKLDINSPEPARIDAVSPHSRLTVWAARLSLTRWHHPPYMKNRAPLIITALFISLLIGCSKHSSVAVTALPKVYNLGVVEVSDGIVSRHDLGDGRVWIVTPAIQKDGSLLIALRIEQDGKLLSAPRVSTKSDQGFEIMVGDVGVGFTPHLKQ